MKKWTSLLMGLVGLMAYSPMAYAEDWILVGATDDMKWHVKPGSLDFGKRQDQIPIAFVVGKVTNEKTGEITPRKWYVTIEDCDNKMGTLVTCKISGEYSYENEYVEGDGRVAGSIAELICGAAQIRVDNNKKKTMENSY